MGESLMFNRIKPKNKVLKEIKKRRLNGQKERKKRRMYEIQMNKEKIL